MKINILKKEELLTISAGYSTGITGRLALMFLDAWNAGRNARHANCDHEDLY